MTNVEYGIPNRSLELPFHTQMFHDYIGIRAFIMAVALAMPLDTELRGVFGRTHIVGSQIEGAISAEVRSSMLGDSHMLTTINGEVGDYEDVSSLTVSRIIVDGDEPLDEGERFRLNKPNNTLSGL